MVVADGARAYLGLAAWQAVGADGGAPDQFATDSGE